MTFKYNVHKGLHELYNRKIKGCKKYICTLLICNIRGDMDIMDFIKCKTEI